MILTDAFTRWRTRAFSLVELLVVMAVIVILLGLATPVFNSMSGANTFAKAIADLSGALEQARAYAMSNNTYVFVGIAEVDAAIGSSQVQQTGIGRVAVGVVASRDGTSIYNPTDAGYAWKTNYNRGANLIPLGRLQYNDNVHLVDLGLPVANGGNLSARQAVPPLARLSNPDPSVDSVTPFTDPLGANLAMGRFNFVRVITFDPQGSARIVNTAGDNAVGAIEIGLQSARGNVFTDIDPEQRTGSIAAIQVDGITGAVRIFRP